MTKNKFRDYIVKVWDMEYIETDEIGVEKFAKHYEIEDEDVIVEIHSQHIEIRRWVDNKIEAELWRYLDEIVENNGTLCYTTPLLPLMFGL